MTREQKAEIARRNGARSKGPKSAEGKAASSRNALKHGRYAALALESAAGRAVAGHEDKERFLRLARRNLAQLRPQSPIERDLAIAIADTQWRYERWNHAETEMLNFELRFIAELNDDSDTWSTAELHARAVRSLACRGDFAKRLTAERTRLLRERAQHLRFYKTIQAEFPQPAKPTKERTEERTNVLDFPVSVNL